MPAHAHSSAENRQWRLPLLSTEPRSASSRSCRAELPSFRGVMPRGLASSAWWTTGLVRESAPSFAGSAFSAWSPKAPQSAGPAPFVRASRAVRALAVPDVPPPGGVVLVPVPAILTLANLNHPV